MKILIACEESQIVCKAFREKGHEAYSCDIQECSGGHPEWHIQDDVTKYLNDGWDMIVAHPPCTYLSNAGARHLYKNKTLQIDRFEKGLIAKEFFMKIYNANCQRIAVENPVASKIYDLPQRTQIIQPYMFGHEFTKRTCLWLRGLPCLIPTNIVEPIRTWCPSGSYSHKHEIRHKGVFTKNRSKNRSKTFPGIAQAMADQWGDEKLTIQYPII